MRLELPIEQSQDVREVFKKSAVYLAHSIAEVVCPPAADRVEPRFKGLLNFRQRIIEETARRESSKALLSAPEGRGLGVAEVAPGYHAVFRYGAEKYLWPKISEIISEFSKVSLTLTEGAPSGRFIPLIVDALFSDYLELNRAEDLWTMQDRFCRKKLAEFLKRYFPEFNLKGKQFKHLQRICSDLQAEVAAVAEADRTFIGDAALNDFSRPSLTSLNPKWQKKLKMIQTAAASKAPILLTGESGTGKEVVSRFIHHQSPRARGPFVAVNCGNLVENIMESELFGFQKGAFTGAYGHKQGLVGQAHNGTLFLDEIGLLAPALQGKLLRFLQEHSFIPLGGLKPTRVDVRVVAATNLDLAAAREEGRFRSDLYYRLNVFQFQLPPLRERLEDLVSLARYFINQYNLENKTRVQGLSARAERLLLRHHWPGNVRELENVIHRAVVLAGSGKIRPEHLPSVITEGSLTQSPGRSGKKLDLEALEQAVAKALSEPGEGRRTRRHVGRSVPLEHLMTFFRDRGRKSFPPRDLADFISPPGQTSRRDKLTHHILRALLQSGILEHNGLKSQKARYCLGDRFWKTSKC